MNNNQPISPLPQHPFFAYQSIPQDPFQTPTMSECLESLERIRCILMYMLSNPAAKKASASTNSNPEIHSDNDGSSNNDIAKGQSHLISSLHDSLRYLSNQMMALHKEDQERIQKQLATLHPLAAKVYGYGLK